jgi:hypothetical protein
MKPYLKAEMLYGLRVLLSIVEEANSGILSKDNAVKKLKEVKWAGDLTGNHLFAVAVLRGLLAPREFLTKPVVAKTLCNAVRTNIFDDDKSMTDERLRKATKMATKHLGIHMLGGEHALCESVRAGKGNDPGQDAYHRDQDFVWISSYEKNGDVGIINDLRPGKRTIRRNEDQDRKAFHKITSGDSNQVKHQWWIPEPNRMDCLAHFVRECLANNSDPLEVMHPSSKGREKSSQEEKKRCGEDTLQWHQTKLTLTPYHWKCDTFTNYPNQAR